MTTQMRLRLNVETCFEVSDVAAEHIDVIFIYALKAGVLFSSEPRIYFPLLREGKGASSSVVGWGTMLQAEAAP
jgi:hypothetical protein